MHPQVLLGYAMIPLSLAWIGIVFAQDWPRAIQWFLWFFNPYTLYGIYGMYRARHTLHYTYLVAIDMWREARNKDEETESTSED